VKRDVGDMSGWRDLVEDHNIDEEINERLGAAAVARVLISEADEMEKKTGKTGSQRMKEMVSKEQPGADAGDIAAMAARGAFNEDFSDEISPARVRASMQEDAGGGEDLTALVLNDNRELADVSIR
jgi:hypothetical protein